MFSSRLFRLSSGGIAGCMYAFTPENWSWKNLSVFTRKCQPPGFNFTQLITNKDIRILNNIIICYDRRRRVARWVCERLFAGQTFDQNSIRYSIFFNDSDINEQFNITEEDFKNTLYKWSYLALPENHPTDPTSARHCHYSSNIAPVVVGIRSERYWFEITNDLRRYISSDCFGGSVYMFTGSLYKPEEDTDTCRKWVDYEVIGSSKISVPTHYYKFIIGESKHNPDCWLLRGFILHNKCPTSEPQRVKDIAELEKDAGLELLSKIDRKNIMYLTDED